MKQTAVEWLQDQFRAFGTITDSDDKRTHQLISSAISMCEQAKQMEQDQMEVSNEEIEKASYDQATFAPSFIAGAKWYRKQIKK